MQQPHRCFVLVWLEINQALRFARLWKVGANIWGLARQSRLWKCQSCSQNTCSPIAAFSHKAQALALLSEGNRR